MFLRSTNRNKDGKHHRYFGIVENRRLRGGKTAQRTVLYLGEINDQQQAAWRKWADLFAADFEVLLYDLTSTYFEGEREQNPKAKRGYSRDGRPACN